MASKKPKPKKQTPAQKYSDLLDRNNDLCEENATLKVMEASYQRVYQDVRNTNRNLSDAVKAARAEVMFFKILFWTTMGGLILTNVLYWLPKK